jgi:hypothetical protein
MQATAPGSAPMPIGKGPNPGAGGQTGEPVAGDPRWRNDDR